MLVDEEVETIVVNAVTEQPLTVTVIKGEQVVIEKVEPLVLNIVSTHCTVTCNAVFENVHDDDDDDELSEVLVDEFEFELLSEFLLSLVRSLVSDVKSFKILSI